MAHVGSLTIRAAWLTLCVGVAIAMITGCSSQFPGALVAHFDCSVSAPYKLQQVEFDAGTSTSKGSQIASYSWQLGDGTTASGMRVVHAYESPGTYKVTLTVTSEDGKNASVTQTISVLPGLAVPVVYPTIQAAIADADDGDVVVILPGTYHENINFLGKAITVQSTDPEDPDVVVSTVIQGMDPGHSVVVFGRGETPEATLAGLTIRGAVHPPVLQWGNLRS